jgi:hypothetical protein
VEEAAALNLRSAEQQQLQSMEYTAQVLHLKS